MIAWLCLYQADSRAVAQLVESIVFVIDSVLPLVRKLPQSVVEDLEQDLKQMIVRHSFLTVVHACIKYNSFSSLLCLNYYLATACLIFCNSVSFN